MYEIAGHSLSATFDSATGNQDFRTIVRSYAKF
jgi:hypothetical protein